MSRGERRHTVGDCDIGALSSDCSANIDRRGRDIQCARDKKNLHVGLSPVSFFVLYGDSVLPCVCIVCRQGPGQRVLAQRPAGSSGFDLPNTRVGVGEFVRWISASSLKSEICWATRRVRSWIHKSDGSGNDAQRSLAYESL